MDGSAILGPQIIDSHARQRFGIEVRSFLGHSVSCAGYIHNIFDTWRVDQEGSCDLASIYLCYRFFGTVGEEDILLTLGVITGLIYFFFSKEHKGALGGAAKVGIWFLMISFGASFGYTVMSRMSLLIGRIYFLLVTWLRILE